jgi:hypothetical protein
MKGRKLALEHDGENRKKRGVPGANADELQGATGVVAPELIGQAGFAQGRLGARETNFGSIQEGRDLGKLMGFGDTVSQALVRLLAVGRRRSSVARSRRGAARDATRHGAGRR